MRHIPAILLSVAAIACAFLGAFGQDSAETPGAEPVVVGRMSIAPTERLDPILARAGIEGAAPMLQELAGKLPFLPKGSVAATQPATVYWVLGAGADPKSGPTIALPLKPGVARIDQLAKAGMKRDPKHEDCCLLPNGTLIRRTEHFLLFGVFTEALASIEEDEILAPYTDETLMAQGSLDCEAVRRVAPDVLDAWLGKMAEAKGTQDAAEKAGSQLVYDLVRDTLDSIELTVSVPGDQLALRMTVAPVELLPAGASFPKPAFPETAFARIDVCYPVDEWLGPASRWIYDSMPKPKSADPDGDGSWKQMLDAILALLTGDAISVAFDEVGQQPVAYLVLQSEEAKDVPALVATFEAALAHMSASYREDLTINSYDEDGQHVTRLEISEKGKPVFRLDLESHGKRVLASMAGTEQRLLSRFRSLEPKGTISDLASGELHASRVSVALRSGLFASKPEGKEVLDFIGDGALEFSGSVKGGAGTLELRAPIECLARAAKLVRDR